MINRLALTKFERLLSSKLFIVLTRFYFVILTNLLRTHMLVSYVYICESANEF